MNMAKLTIRKEAGRRVLYTCEEPSIEADFRLTVRGYNNEESYSGKQ